jgi:hypothetical protein
LSSELKLADLEAEDLSKEILACEKKVYETFLGPQGNNVSLDDLGTIPSNAIVVSKTPQIKLLKCQPAGVVSG